MSPTQGAPAPTVDIFQLIVDVSQVLGAVIGVIALIVALRARSGARRDLAKERRTVYELDLLRRLDEQHNHDGRALSGPDSLAQLFTHLVLLPDIDEMPMTRAAVRANSTWTAPPALARRSNGVTARSD